MNEQIDIAVDLGVMPPPLPEIEFLREFVANVPQPQIIDRLLYQGCNMGLISGSALGILPRSLRSLRSSLRSLNFLLLNPLPLPRFPLLPTQPCGVSGV